MSDGLQLSKLRVAEKPPLAKLPLYFFVGDEIACVGLSEALRDPLEHVEVIENVLESAVVWQLVQEF